VNLIKSTFANFAMLLMTIFDSIAHKQKKCLAFLTVDIQAALLAILIGASIVMLTIIIVV
jgi:hypothetical protein